MFSWHLFWAQLILGKVAMPGEVGEQHHYVWIGASGVGQDPVVFLLLKGAHL